MIIDQESYENNVIVSLQLFKPFYIIFSLNSQIFYNFCIQFCRPNKNIGSLKKIKKGENQLTPKNRHLNKLESNISLQKNSHFIWFIIESTNQKSKICQNNQ